VDIKKLDVYRGTELIGQLFDEPEIRFVYAQSILENRGKSISPTLSFLQKEYIDLPVESFFENLLPEAGIQELLKLKN